MFVMLTIVCVVLGLVARPAEEQRRAVETLRALDYATVLYDFERLEPHPLFGDMSMVSVQDSGPPGPAWLRDLIGVDYFANVEHISSGCDVVFDFGSTFDHPGGINVDDDLSQLRHFRKLESLS